ncbi:GntR family transcriptional regulator [Nonomuraea lactucae]|uniref:GntR family transcriptional regulator n=1 Tax=Nonomuraea lactucae TaxID=2249762 RepID=UPI0013B44146|nr:GntR family transcriptional regulator [Nonomuraea lactucae]
MSAEETRRKAVPVTVHPKILHSQVLEWLRESLISGLLVPGQRVNEVQIATQVGVSRGTLREALRKLEQEGLLVSVPHKGTFVRKLTPTQVRDVYEVLAMLEGRAARRAAERLTPEGAKRLSGLLDHFEQVLADPTQTLRQRQDADLAFHEAVCELADSEALLTTWRAVRGRVMAVVLNVGEEILTPLQDPGSHRRLLQALLTDPPGVAEETFHSHLMHAADVIVGILE